MRWSAYCKPTLSSARCQRLAFKCKCRRREPFTLTVGAVSPAHLATTYHPATLPGYELARIYCTTVHCQIEAERPTCYVVRATALQQRPTSECLTTGPLWSREHDKVDRTGIDRRRRASGATDV